MLDEYVYRLMGVGLSTVQGVAAAAYQMLPPLMLTKDGIAFEAPGLDGYRVCYLQDDLHGPDAFRRATLVSCALTPVIVASLVGTAVLTFKLVVIHIATLCIAVAKSILGNTLYDSKAMKQN